MVRNGEIAMADVKRVFRKYWWITPFSLVVLASLGYIATLVLPKKYTSTTSVLVEQPEIPVEFVKPVVTIDLNQRLASMKAQLLSTSRLQPIIDKFALFPEERNKNVAPEVLVGNLQKAVDITLLEPMVGSSSRQPPGFRVSVTYDNPHVAQQICQEVTSMFLEQNAERRAHQVNTTTAFLG